MEIKTKRCTIRRFEEKDIDDLIQYRNNESWMQYQGFKGFTKEMYARELLSESSFVNGVQLAIINNASNRLIGDIYLKKENRIFWIGYTINPHNAQQGYAYEVLVEIISWLKQNGCTSINAGVLPVNLASIHLLKKLKFTYASTDDQGEQIYTLDLLKI